MSNDLVPATQPQGEIVGFDYSTITDPDVAIEAKAVAQRIRANVRSIGADLLTIKEKLGHGLFTKWVKDEFDWTIKTAERRMDMAELVAKNDKLSILPDALINAVVAAPKDMREDLERRVADGELKLAKDVRRAVDHGRLAREKAEREEAKAEAEAAAEAASELRRSKPERDRRKTEKEAEADREARRKAKWQADYDANKARVHGLAVLALDKLVAKIGHDAAWYAYDAYRNAGGSQVWDAVGAILMQGETPAGVEPVDYAVEYPVETSEPVEQDADLDYEDTSPAGLAARQAFRNASQDLGEALTIN